LARGLYMLILCLSSSHPPIPTDRDGFKVLARISSYPFLLQAKRKEPGPLVGALLNPTGES